MEWKDIEIPNYEISNNGIIRNKKTQHILAQRVDKSIITHHYYRVRLSMNGKSISRRVHRLLAQAFIPNPENKPFVDHIDGNTLNNQLENLRWATPQDNSYNCKIYKNNKLGVKGVQQRYGKFRARIRHNNKLIIIGTFNTIEEASKAYQDYAQKLAGDFSCCDR